MCKYWKVNGHRTESEDGERFSDHRRRVAADLEIASVPSVRSGPFPFDLVSDMVTVANVNDGQSWLIL